MADPQHYTDAQLSDGTTLRFLGQLGPDQVRDKVAAFRLRRPDLSAPPPAAGGQFAGTAAPKQTSPQAAASMQPGPEGFEADPNNPNHNPYAGVPGAQPMNRPVQGRDLVPGAIAGGAAAAVAAPTLAASSLPFLKQQAAKHPLLTQALASEAISQARNIPVVGKMIPPYSEWLPFLLGGKGASAEGEVPPRGSAPRELPPSTDQLPGRPYQPNPRYEPAPQPEPLPPRNGPLLLKGEVQSPQPTSRAALGRQLDQPLRSAVGAPPAPQAGVPIGMTPVESSAVKAFRYDPAAQEMHVMTNDGTTYVHGEVSPEQAQAFQASPSKGQAWQDIRNNSTLVGKVPPKGNRIAVKPAMKLRSASPQDQPPPNDLTDILTRSLQQVKQRGQ